MPLTGPKVPPETSMSPVLPSQVKLLPGSSLKRNVINAVLPTPTTCRSLVMVTVGARVSTLKIGVAPALPVLPARSV